MDLELNLLCPVQALSVLQDRLPPFESDVAYQVIEAELKRPISQIYSELTPEPIAAASLGQVQSYQPVPGISAQMVSIVKT